MKRLDALITMQKNQNSFCWIVFEKIRPDRQMGPKKITSFAVLFFSFLLKNGPFNEASFFLTQLS